MDTKIIMDSRRHQKRRTRDRDIRSNSNEGSKRGSQSPPQSRVVILAKNPQKSGASSVRTQNITVLSSTPTPNIQVIQSYVKSSQSANTSTNNAPNNDEVINEMVANMPPVMKLIDSDSLIFMESAISDYLFSDSMCPSGFTVISAVGLQGVGKSSILNAIADKQAFKIHELNQTNEPLKHMTRGIDLHITRERLLLLDTQPLLSASVLDEYLKCSPPSSSTGVDIAEPENYSFMISLQILSFLFATCDYIIIVCDWMVDIHLVKLMATAVMMVGDTAPKADIIWYFTDAKANINARTIELLMGRSLSVNVICCDEKQLLKNVTKAPSKRLIGENARNSLNSSEKSWLLTAQRFWESSIRKSTLYSDYGRFLP